LWRLRYNKFVMAKNLTFTTRQLSILHRALCDMQHTVEENPELALRHYGGIEPDDVMEVEQLVHAAYEKSKNTKTFEVTVTRPVTTYETITVHVEAPDADTAQQIINDRMDDSAQGVDDLFSDGYETFQTSDGQDPDNQNAEIVDVQELK
jgi:hypothetical protein